MSDVERSTANIEHRNAWNPPKEVVKVKGGVEVTFREWEQNDLPAILEMAKSRDEIDYAESDITCFIECQDFYGVVAENTDGLVVAFVGFMKYGSRIFTAGQLNVIPQFREKRLTLAVLSYCIKLIPKPDDYETFHYGCKENNDYYSKINVQIDDEYGTFQRIAGYFSNSFLESGDEKGIEVRELCDDYQSLFSYDQSVYRFNRSEPLRNICNHPKSKTFVAFRDGTICGYGIFRIGRFTNKVAPLFADCENTARSLYRRIGKEAPVDRKVAMIVPTQNKFVMGIIKENSFELVDERWRSKRTVTTYSQDIGIDYNKVYSITGLSYALC